jgi:dTDP-4-dehydrorhamnose reductase
MSTRILVVGRSGQVAWELARLRGPEGVTIEALGRDRFDITDLAALPANLRASHPHIVINTATTSGVDSAESQPDLARLLNCDAPAALARACAELGVPLLHLSTDCVFDGAKAGAYVETDAKVPLSVYGRTKAEGEDAVLASGATAAILRTSWVFSARGKNFVRSMLALAQTHDEVRVVSDQIGCPTWTPDLAHASVAVALWLRQRAPGEQHVFHYAGAEAINRAEQAEAIFEAAAARGLKRARVVPVSTSEFPTPARRPLNARLDSSKIVATLGLVARPWRAAITLVVDEIAAAAAR